MNILEKNYIPYLWFSNFLSQFLAIFYSFIPSENLVEWTRLRGPGLDLTRSWGITLSNLLNSYEFSFLISLKGCVICSAYSTELY